MTSVDARPAACPLCEGPNGCPRATPGPCPGSCWCAQVDIPTTLLARVPEGQRDRACICPSCVARFNRAQAYHPRPGPGDVYHDPDGRWVFTATYHRRRGYCCGSGCRHCPYEDDAPLQVA